MRARLLGCLLGLGLAAMAGVEARAQDEGLFPWQVSRNHPWCAFENATGRTECLYNSIAQCRASVSGVGGFCERNPAFVAAPPPPPRRARAPRTRS